MYNDNEDNEIPDTENGIVTYTLDTSGAIDIAGKNENDKYKYIDNISVSYQADDKEWIKIEQDNSSLPADADYRLEVSYKDIEISELLANGGKMMLDGIPNWLNPDEDGEILIDSVPVASMHVQNGKLFISFESVFMNAHSTKNLSGSFFVRGSVNWQELTNNKGEIHLPTIDMTINFEDNLPQKYGQMRISKSDPELVYDDNDNKQPYFKYTVTVESSEAQHTIPAVKVYDKFTRNAGFIQGYSGITETPITLDSSGNGFNPYETITLGNTGTSGNAGTVNIDSQGMCWNIGDLQPLEKRTLTYYAKIDPYYIGSCGRGSITNTAELFSGDVPKGSDSSEFTPRAEAWINKEFVNAEYDDYGTGTATYKINVTAGRYNNYDLINLRLHDYFDSRFKGFVTYPDNVTVTRGDGNTFEITTQILDGTSFNATIPVLKPNETITVEYTVNLTNILASGTGNIDFLNTAELFSEEKSERGGASNRHFGSSQNWHTFSQSQWLRKLDGGTLTQNETITPNTGEAYEFSENSIHETTLPQSFTVPKGSKKYQVVINEKGTWDLSSATMKDKFNNTSIIYKGWLCIQAFENSGVNKSLTDAEVISKLSNQNPSKTVWLNINNMNEFSFTPSQLGLSEKYAYLMTYYAGVTDADNTGELMITNDFEIYGTIGVGGTTFQIVGIKVGVSSIVQGNIHYTVHKDSWYYSEYPEKEENVPINSKDDYPNGALYWVIKLDGTINAEFRVKDLIRSDGGESHNVCLDTLAGIYKGSKFLDFTSEFPSYSAMLKNVGNGKKLEKISGNQYNFGRYYGWETGYNSDNIGMVYDRTDINNISELDGKKFVIASVNSSWNLRAVVTNTTDGSALYGNKNINYLNNTAIAFSDTLTEWTFEQVSGNRYYVYSEVNGETKYISISDDKSVSLSDNPTTLYIKQDSKYSGQIKITNENGMALNWYGGYNSGSTIFGGWKSDTEDDNDYQMLFETKDDYKWCAVTGGDVGICFQRDMNLKDNESLYIVVRTVPSTKQLNYDDGSKRNPEYTNGVASKQNSSASDWIKANDTSYIVKTAPATYKEGKTSYTFDGTNWKYSKGEEYADGYERIHFWKTDLVTESGTYAEWLINVNWNGSMKGLAEVSDQLPENVTPVYVREFYIASTQPTYPTIPELETNDNWINYNTYGIPFYYNPATREIRWRVDNLTKEEDDYKINTQTVNLQLICKINDIDILLSGKDKNVDNTVTVKNNGIVSKSVGTVPVSPKCSLHKSYKGNMQTTETTNGTKSYTSDKILPFEITVNENKETLSNDGFLPPLIDEFSNNLVIVESSIEVKYENGSAVNGYTYKIENNQLIINKLPDKKKIIITYNARTTGIVDKDHDIYVSNRAYWSGHEPTDTWQVDSLTIRYSMGGEASLSDNPTVSILKVDSENNAKRLQGAVFKLCKYEGNSLVETGTTGTDGKFTFGNNATKLSYNTVYYIEEETAPYGYSLSTEKHCFVIFKKQEGQTVTDFSSIPNIDIWDAKINGSEYEFTIKNSKERITVNKIFSDDKNGNSAPDSSKFRFGIFDKNPERYPQTKPLQILEIEYINGQIYYKLDNIQKTAPEFTVAQPNQSYYVFELDEFQKPISNGKYLNAGGKTYEVKYTSNVVTVARN